MPYPSTVAQIETKISALATTYSAICTKFDCPHKTYEGGTAASPGRTVSYLRIGTGTGNGRPRILIVGGMHAREWAPPDAVLVFVEKLLDAYTHSRPITYGDFRDFGTPRILYHAFTIPFDPDVKQIIERTELYVLPLANPDGRAYTMPPTKIKGWRKNRRPAPSATPSCPPLPAGIPADDLPWLSNDPAGVDLNRNFDIAWDIHDFYSASFFTALATVPPPIGLGVSDSPCAINQVYHGPGSTPRPTEPETQNISELITSKHINFYMDVHSAAGKFLYAWGMGRNQNTDATKSFKNTALNIGSGGPGRDAEATYGEWMPPGVESQHQTLGDLMRDAILDSTGYTAGAAATDATANAARNRSMYQTVPSTLLFSSTRPDFETGVSRDFAFSQMIGATSGTPISATSLDPVFSYTFECGRRADGFFQPDATKQYPKVEREVAAGLWKFMTYAAAWHAPVPPPTPAPTGSTSPPQPTPPPPSGSSSSCFFTTACYGSPLYRYVQYLRHLRDREIRTTRPGSRFLDWIEPVYYRFSPRIADFLRKYPMARTSVRTLAVAPGIYWIRMCWAMVSEVKPASRRVRGLLGLIFGGGAAAAGGALLLARWAMSLLAGH